MKDTQKHIWQNLPKKPGVYLFKDENGTILYAGKAINLRSRVSSYFLGKNNDRPWITVMLGTVNNVETIVVDTEVEALMLEATLIKQHMPRFNIKLTDDKAYPYIKVVIQEPIPRFYVTRRQSDDKALYFGPYLSARSATYALEFLRRIYGIHISPRPLRANRDRACLSCQLGSFACPLSGEVDEETYRCRTTSAVDFLQGKRRSILKDLHTAMERAAKDEKYELAAKVRDRIQAIEHVLTRQNIISTTMDDYDAIGVYKTNHTAVVSSLRIQEGRITGQKAFRFDLRGDETNAEIIRNFIISLYLHYSDIPGLIIVGEPIDDAQAVEQLIRESSGRAVELRATERGEKKSMLLLAEKNARAKLETFLLKSDQSLAALINLQELLKLETLPHRIEAVDISNLGTSEPVSATVCFIDGKPDKNEYRRYKIKTVTGQNDFAMIREVVQRRFSDTSRPAPDLFIVDGGPEQLKFALQGLVDAPTQPGRIISLAKKPDRIFFPGRKMPIPAARGQKGLLLLSRIRDEVHRFAIGFQRQRQSKRSLGVE